MTKRVVLASVFLILSCVCAAETQSPGALGQADGKRRRIDPRCRGRYGLFPVPDDETCTTYIRCRRGKATVHTCPDRQRFDPVKYCTHDPVHCGRQTGSLGENWRKPRDRYPRDWVPYICSDYQPDGMYPYPVNCNQYVGCINGAAYVYSCIRMWHFNNETRMCEDPCKAKCDPDFACECGWDTCTKTTTPLPTFLDEKLRPTCKWDGFYSIPGDCRKFADCSRGRIYVYDCPLGFHFDPRYRLCDKPCWAACDLTLDCNSTDSTPKLQQTSVDVCELRPYRGPPCDAYVTRWYFDSDDGTCKEFMHGGCPGNGNVFKTEKECSTRCLRDHPVEQPDFKCSVDGLFRNPYNCSTYFQCSGGRSYVMPCPEGLHFDEKAKRCEEPCHARCDASIAEDCGLETTEFTKQDVVCLEDGLLSNRGDCTTYFQCSNGHIFVMSCPEGLHFSEQTLRCEIPCEARCDARLGKVCGWGRPSPKQPIFDFRCLRNGLFENHADCGTFVQCTGGSAYLISCPVGLHFSPSTQKCETPCEARCQPDIEEKCKEQGGLPPSHAVSEKQSPVFQTYDCARDGFHPHNRNCSLFVHCYAGHGYVKPCPQGLHFGRDRGRCEWPCDAKCDSTLGERCGWELADYGLRKPEYDFACTLDGLHPDPEGCATYVRCSEGVAYVVSCPQGLHFGPVTLRCQQPYDAQCDPSLATTPSDQVEGDHDGSNFLPTGEPVCAEDSVYGNPEDCTQYFACVNARPHLHTCPEGTHFSPRNRGCLPPCEAHCNRTLACECDWPECNRRVTVVDCEQEYDSGPCEGHLTRYYYDVQSGQCRTFVYGGCGGNFNRFRTEQECRRECRDKMLGGFQCPYGTSNGLFGHNPDCTLYYQCKRGVPTLKKCPDGTAFDHLRSKCVTEFKATCLYECREPDAVYPHDQDYRKYIDCVNGVPKLETCPPGYAFDPTQKDCVTYTPL